MRHRTRFGLAISAAILCGLTGCQPSQPPGLPAAEPSASSAHRGDESEPPPPCYAHTAATGVLMDDLAALTRACSVPQRERELMPAREGKQGQSDAVDRFSFTAAQGRCFRLYAVGDADVTDIDIQMIGADGEVIAADSSHQGRAVVPANEAICVPQAGTYQVEVSVARGAGRYLMQVWAR